MTGTKPSGLTLRCAAVLVKACRALSEFFDSLANRLSICPNCGRNRYTGKPCKGDDND